MTSPFRFLTTVLALGLVLTLSACDSDDPTTADDPNIGTLAGDTPTLSTLATALSQASLVDDLDGSGPFTVFAPVNSAFDALGDDVVSRLLDPANAAILSKVLTYHVVPGEVFAADITDGLTASTLQGGTVTLNVSGGDVTVDGVRIIQTDIVAGNGVIHFIDGVLTTPLNVVETATIQGFETLVGALVDTELDDDLEQTGPFTVFAPTEEAFAAISDVLPTLTTDELANILLYHVISGKVLASDLSDGLEATMLNGGTITIDLDGGPAIDTDGDGTNEANIILTDLEVSNGVIHAIDAVLLP